MSAYFDPKAFGVDGTEVSWLAVSHIPPTPKTPLSRLNKSSWSPSQQDYLIEKKKIAYLDPKAFGVDGTEVDLPGCKVSRDPWPIVAPFNNILLCFKL